jgi:hypothetical protein
MIRGMTGGCPRNGQTSGLPLESLPSHLGRTAGGHLENQSIGGDPRVIGRRCQVVAATVAGILQAGMVDPGGHSPLAERGCVWSRRLSSHRLAGVMGDRFREVPAGRWLSACLGNGYSGTLGDGTSAVRVPDLRADEALFETTGLS